MKNWISSLFILVLVLFCGSVKSAIIESFDLNVLTSSGTNSSEILEIGTEYEIKVSGTFVIGSPVTGIADAEYFDIPNSPTDLFFGDIGVQINGADIDWGPFNIDSVYTTSFIGLGDIINISYFDGNNYGDNSGSLQIVISGPDTQQVPVKFGLMSYLTCFFILIYLRRNLTFRRMHIKLMPILNIRSY